MKNRNKTVVELNGGRVIDHTGLSDAAAFIVDKLRRFDLLGLKLHLKWHRQREVLGYGYFRPTDYRTVAAVASEFTYPFRHRKMVLTRQSGGRPKRIYDEEMIHDVSEALVCVAGHEVWHFLCKTEEKKGDWHIGANVFGYVWLREFKKVRGRVCKKSC